MKKAVGWAALGYVQPNTIIGVGTGSTVNCFIDALASIKDQIKAAVSSSEASTLRLKALAFRSWISTKVDSFDVYIDGADEINGQMEMIKGGGAALTREKIVAAVAKRFVCTTVDSGKVVEVMGRFPLPVEVIPMAREFVARELRKLGGEPVYRTWRHHRQWQPDPGCARLADHQCQETRRAESTNIVGVVTVGLFAKRGADVALVGSPDGVKTIVR
jgi:ribose 5-phosphate isomerase A